VQSTKQLSRRERFMAGVYSNPLVRLGIPTVRRLMHGMTFGVRVAAVRDGRVLLVQHGYSEGWHLPGGGVDFGETAAQAGARELLEETGCEARGELVLHALYFNPRYGKRNHIALYVVRDWVQGPKPPASAEILDSQAFAIDQLPQATTEHTRRRLAEILDGVPADPIW
jgi:8-oxo-dGTP pyrophosphatase MutT (NUDIX family)